ncbi:AAA family ATPase [Planktothrix sp. FACHB-1355]|uniref:AAA family ATPase n=1 Tax=Aerosakkonema funiforme FACHB-1375 TaxID=2949571 RepID=A0A926VJ20_9CYAN|nr:MULTISPECIES: ATP-binding protein [Oscillatoriales]MBD2184795.1 AAA family ATPase [Aerosakkonema funiforme FACHB-1375]MBD3557443.1 AAA family ATPase [Planktothrix sp. FACHB-1355]
MTTLPRFPRELLQASKSERLAYFSDCTVVHRRLKEAYDNFVEAITNPGGAALVFLFGPTGVGKTTLLYQVMKVLIEQNLLAMALDPGFIPVATVEAHSPELGNFDWKDYYKSVLVALADPFVEYKLKTRSSRTYGSGKEQHLAKSKANLSSIREDVEYTMSQRQLIAFLVDEAQRFTKMASGRRLQDQMDAIVSMAGMTNTLHGLFGTYELLEFRNLSAQLSRRSIDIHFQRYQVEYAEDIIDFKRVLKSFACQMPLPEEPDLELHWEYFYERSIGCVGIVKDWLTQALRKALDAEASTLTLVHLKPYAPSVSKCMQMITEAIEGEKALIEDETELIKLRQKLGLTAISSPIAKEASPDNMANSAQTSKTSRKKRNPGERNPHRDVIGGTQNVS